MKNNLSKNKNRVLKNNLAPDNYRNRFVDGKMINIFEIHDRLVLYRDLQRFLGMTDKIRQNLQW